MSAQELIARLEAATADDKSLFEDTWEHLCQTSFGFRRYACTSVDDYGLTVTGRFCRFVDVGAYESAALLMVPKGWGGAVHSSENRQHHVAKLGRSHPTNANAYAEAPTPALAICIAALRARHEGEGA